MATKQRIGSRGFRITIGVLVFLVVGYVAIQYPGYKQRRDMAAVRDYLAVVRPQLASDPRFMDVHLLGYSCGSSPMNPYIPVVGSVKSQADLEALDKFIRASVPPVRISVRLVRIMPAE